MQSAPSADGQGIEIERGNDSGLKAGEEPLCPSPEILEGVLDGRSSSSGAWGEGWLGGDQS